MPGAVAVAVSVDGEEGNGGGQQHQVVVEAERRRQQRADQQGRRFERIPRRAAPEPDQRSGNGERDETLDDIGQRDAAAPQPHPGKDALHLEEADIALLEQDNAGESH